MMSSSLVAFPIAFGVIYLVVCFSVVVVAIKTTGTTSNNTKTPLVCGAGAHPPAYYIYSIGSSISALLFIGSAISHAHHVGNLVPDQRGFLWIIDGVGCIASILMAAMGIIPMRDPYKTKHNVVGIIFISLGCCYSGMLVGAAFAVGPYEKTKFPLVTVIVRLVAAILLGVSCTVSFVHLQKAEASAKKRKKQQDHEPQQVNNGNTGGEINNENTQLTTTLPSGSNDKKLQQTTAELSAWKIAAIGQYVALVGVALVVTSLALELSCPRCRDQQQPTLSPDA